MHMKRLTQILFVLLFVVGGSLLNSCDNALKDDMMTPGGLIGGGGSGGSGGGGGTNPGGGGGGGTNPGGGDGGGGGTNPGGGGGGTSSDPYNLVDYLHLTQWYDFDDPIELMHSLYFYSTTVTYIRKEASDDTHIYFTGTYTVNNLTLTFSFSQCFIVDDYGNKTNQNLNNYSLSKTATMNSDRTQIVYDGHTLKKDD